MRLYRCGVQSHAEARLNSYLGRTSYMQTQLISYSAWASDCSRLMILAGVNIMGSKLLPTHRRGTPKSRPNDQSANQHINKDPSITCTASSLKISPLHLILSHLILSYYHVTEIIYHTNA